MNKSLLYFSSVSLEQVFESEITNYMCNFAEYYQNPPPWECDILFPHSLTYTLASIFRIFIILIGDK